MRLLMPSPPLVNLQKLVLSEEQDFDSFLKTLNEAPLVSNLQMLLDFLKAHVSPHPTFDHVQAAEALVSLYFMRLHDPNTVLSVKDFVESVINTICVGINPSYDQKERFRLALTQILRGESAFGLSMKANTVLTQNQRNFTAVRIISDIRCLYSEDERPQDPLAALIVHSLKIQYVEHNQIKDFYVGLDSGELSELRRAIERAELKAKSLKEIIAKSGTTFIDVEGV